MKINISLTVFYLAFHLLNVAARNGTTTSSITIKGDGRTVSFTVGQVIDNSYSGDNGAVYEGIQNVYEITETSNLNNQAISLKLIVAPIPFIGYIVLKMDETNLSGLSYNVYDRQGKLIS